MRFEYHAYDKSGKPVRGTVEAEDKRHAEADLAGKGLFVDSIREGGSGSSKARKRKRRSGIPTATVSEFARELAVLVSTGTPVVESIASLERQTHDEKWKAVVHDVKKRIEEGASFCEALEAHDNVFDEIFRSLVEAGEASGKLGEMLTSLADLTRRQEAAKKAVKGAMVYPIALICIAIVVLCVMMIVVLPRFSKLFESLGADIPGTTQMLLTAGELLRTGWWWMLLGIGAGVFGVRWWAGTEQGEKTIGAAVVSAPIIGKVSRSLITARIIRLLGVLLHGKVPMVDSIEMVKRSVTNSRYSAMLADAESSVVRGEAISDVFRTSGLIPESICEAVRNGEQSGRMSNVLLSLAEHMEEENQTTLKSLGTLMEPAIMLVLGVVIGFVAISMFLPMFDLTASAGGG